MGRPLISIVTPCYNEEANVRQHLERVRAAIAPFRERYDFEHIYTDNCSQDRTFAILQELGAQDPAVKAIRFSRNIGANRAIYLGLQQAKGDAIVLIQADLQDPPELIPDFIRGWEEGNEVVFGQIRKRSEGVVVPALRRLYYQLVARVADVAPPQNAGEFRITSRRVLDAMFQYSEDDPYLRGRIAHVGFKQKGIPYDRAPRAGGTTSTNFVGLLAYGINGIISTATVAPIRAVVVLGILTSMGGFAFAAFTVVAKLILRDEVPRGISMLAALITFFSGVQLFALGIIGEYIRKIYVQSLHRPLGFIQDRVNL